jgi:hypothetical protein
VRNEYSWNKGERFLRVAVTTPEQNFWCTLAPFGWSFFSVEKGQKNCEVLISFPFWYPFVVPEANMLYLESPAGVGFSYSTDPSFYQGVGDSITGEF